MGKFLFFLWQAVQETKPNSNNEVALYITIASSLSVIGGAALKSLFDFLTNRKTVNSNINVSTSTIKKNENEIIANLQEKLLSTQRLLMEMQENLDKWIKRFEKSAEEASEVEDELRIVRRNCNACISGRKDYYEFCIELNHFMMKIETIFNQMVTENRSPILKELKGLMESMNELQSSFEKDHPVK